MRACSLAVVTCSSNKFRMLMTGAGVVEMTAKDAGVIDGAPDFCARIKLMHRTNPFKIVVWVDHPGSVIAGGMHSVPTAHHSIHFLLVPNVGLVAKVIDGGTVFVGRSCPSVPIIISSSSSRGLFGIVHLSFQPS